MKKTVYIPDDLYESFERYLQEHPGETLSSVVQEALQKKIAQDRATKFLELAGLVQEAPRNASEQAEDYDVFVNENRP